MKQVWLRQQANTLTPGFVSRLETAPYTAFLPRLLSMASSQPNLQPRSREAGPLTFRPETLCCRHFCWSAGVRSQRVGTDSGRRDVQLGYHLIMPRPHSPDAYVFVTAQYPGQCSFKLGRGAASHVLWEGREKVSSASGRGGQSISCYWPKEALSYVLSTPPKPCSA